MRFHARRRAAVFMYERITRTLRRRHANARPVTTIHTQLADGRELKSAGRAPWALAVLIAAGDRRISTIQHPAPRWSQYVFRLRLADVGMLTTDEKHGGPYGGEHGRYRLTSAVEVLEESHG